MLQGWLSNFSVDQVVIVLARWPYPTFGEAEHGN